MDTMCDHSEPYPDDPEEEAAVPVPTPSATDPLDARDIPLATSVPATPATGTDGQPREEPASAPPKHEAPARELQRGRAPAAEGPRKDWVLVVGVETVPDRAAMPAGSDPDAMPKPMFHQVAALAFVRASVHVYHVNVPNGTDNPERARFERYEVEECRAGGTPASDEKMLLMGFWKKFGEWKPVLAGFNSRNFVVPVLRYRSMRHKLTAAFLHSHGDKYRNYFTRGLDGLHVDVMDAISDRWPSPSLAETAAVLGLPIRGQDFPDPEVLVSEGRIDDVRAMAMANVATTFLALIRWKLLKGDMNLADHDAAMESLRKTLEAIPSPRPAITQLLAAWPRG